ncbi:MAG: hypothetical protein Q9227_000605 [Pyrenula ochraceoflavens]
MATAVASTSFSLPSKIKRPAPPTLQTSANGTKLHNPSPSPSSASKRLPGQKQSPYQAPTNGVPINGSMARPNRPRKESGRPDPSQRLHRLSTRSGAIDGSGHRASKIFPEPYMVTESHILKKYPPKDNLPSLIIHLHPTYFRFDNQEGSFSYHSEMRIFIEHLQKRTVPHDILEELRKENVRFYDGWLIVRVVDHKSVAETSGSSSANQTDGKIPYSIHNYEEWVTPSPYVPYPSREKTDKSGTESATKSPPQKREHQPRNEGPESSNALANGTSLPKKEPKIYHVALRPTTLSRHQDIIIDSMTPDPKSLNRRQSHAASSRTPGSATMPAPPTPLAGVPQTPAGDKPPPAKKVKMKVEAKDLLDYEAKIINSTATPLYLDRVEGFEEAQLLIDSLRDPLHEELPPSPKGRKRTVAELAADEAMARDQERFMTIMDDRLASSDAVGNSTAAAVDGQSGVLFNPRFERFNALETIKAKAEERRAIEHEEQMNAQRQKEQRQEELKRQNAANAARLNNEMMNKRNHLDQRNVGPNPTHVPNGMHHGNNASLQHNMPNASQNVPVMPQQAQMLRTSQPQVSSPIIRNQTPHQHSSPNIGSMPQAVHSVPMNASMSNQGAGSPPRPNSALQHSHPGVTMTRGPSQQGPSRHGTPQMPQSTPAIPHSTPAMRVATPIQQRMSNASPHNSNMASTPQMSQPPMMATHQANSVQNLTPQQRRMVMQMHLQQQQQQQQQHGMGQQPNGHPMSQQAQAMAIMNARQHQVNHQAALQQSQTPHNIMDQEEYRNSIRRIQAQQMASQQQTQHPQQPQPQQQAQMEATARAHANAQAQAHHAQAQAHAQQQHSSPPHHMPTPQHHPAQMVPQHSSPGVQHHSGMAPNQQHPGQPSQLQQAQRVTMQREQMANRFKQIYNAKLSELHLRYGTNNIPQPLQAACRVQAENETRQFFQTQQQQAMRQMAAARGQIPPQMQRQQFTPQQIQQLQQQQHQAQQFAMMHHQQQQGNMMGMPGSGVMPK